jgi:PTS system nitrogen regulatory IIA component
LTNLITLEAIIPSLKATSKKQALQELSERAAELSGLPAREILDALIQRERLGSTGTGDGIAIPHAKLAKAKEMFGLFARTPRPIDFESLDGAPVDLIFLLVAPESAGADHLKALARLARMLRDPATTAKLRAARDANALYSVLTGETASHAA